MHWAASSLLVLFFGQICRALPCDRHLGGTGAPNARTFPPTRVVSFQLAPTKENPNFVVNNLEPTLCTWQLYDEQMVGLILSLVKALLGSSILTLSAGLSNISDRKAVAVMGLCSTVFFAGLSAYTYTLIGECCYELGASSYTELWSETISDSSAWIPTAACLMFTEVALFVYTVIIRDMLSALAVFFQLSPYLLRREVHLGLMGGVLLPLCLLRALSSIANVARIGIVGVVYTMCFMLYRYFTGAYELSGHFSQHRGSKPIFGTHLNPMKTFRYLALMNGCYQVEVLETLLATQFTI